MLSPATAREIIVFHLDILFPEGTIFEDNFPIDLAIYDAIGGQIALASGAITMFVPKNGMNLQEWIADISKGGNEDLAKSWRKDREKKK